MEKRVMIGGPNRDESAQYNQAAGIQFQRSRRASEAPLGTFQYSVQHTGSTQLRSAPAEAAASRSARPRGGWGSHHASASLSTRVRSSNGSAARPKSETGEPKKEAKENEAPPPPRGDRRTRTDTAAESGCSSLRVTNGGLLPHPHPPPHPPSNPRSSWMRRLPVTSSLASRAMEGCFSRDLLRGIGVGDALQREEGPRPPRVEMEEEVELSLGLSLGGRFGLERRAEKLARSSSVAAILMPPPEGVVAAPAFARTSSLPVKAETIEMGMKQGLGGWGSCRENGGQVAAMQPGSGTSSGGEGQRAQDPLMRATSLPAGFDDDSRKRKAAQSLKRHELKNKRIERRNSLTCNISKEAVEQVPEVMDANTTKLESCNEVVTRNKQNHSNDKHPMNGLPPMHQAMRKKHNSAFKGTTGAKEHNPPSDVPLLGEGDQQNISCRAAARAKSMGDAERIMMQEMPSVFIKGLPNGNKVEGFLYKYRKGEEVRIVCVCHGSFLTPAEFVKHAGGGDVANPLRHIVVNPAPQPFL